MKRVEKQRKPLVFRVKNEGGAPSLQVVREEPVDNNQVPAEEVFYEISPGQEPAASCPSQTGTPEQPPLPAVDAIFVNRDGNMTGPFTEKELRRHWANGVIYSDDYVWKEGMPEWVVLGSYFGVPVLSAKSASVSALSKGRRHEMDSGSSDAFVQSWLVLPAIFSILSMLSALFFVFIIPENITYFSVACGLTLVLALVVCCIGRKLSLVVLMALNVLLPVLAWYYLAGEHGHPHDPGNTVEQKEEDLPASLTPKVASKKV